MKALSPNSKQLETLKCWNSVNRPGAAFGRIEAEFGRLVQHVGQILAMCDSIGLEMGLVSA